ncbi:MAG: right-handed parallel beta-helix repeat-containing protein [Chloroflexi bacterium]|nr:right-handed parallel beta-helix repeat-containing protein [Chloroflexota bacterium]
MSTRKKWLYRILGAIVGLLAIAFLIAGFAPVGMDPVVPPEQYGAGSSSVQPSYTGLLREFPPENAPADNPTTPEKAELGRLLFFDPVLSANNDLACATCHHPDYGFSDGLAQAMGANGTGVGLDRTGGVVLTRNTPTLWNVGYNKALFWDGRGNSLEDQSTTPITHVDEMAADPTELVAEINSIPEYVALFEQAFGGSDAVTMVNVQFALAAFQRTLVTNNSPFDQYAAGQIDALTGQQRRGLDLFRSGATRCFECHAAPTFATETFRVVGVPSEDQGRAAIVADAAAGSFKVPTLRNIALTAPYMHNGALATLEEVIEFYADGGGRAHGITGIDDFVQGFDFTDQEKADMVAFLYALTDESSLPDIPATVPSGLPVVTHIENPARDAAALHNSAIATGVAASRAPQTHTVEPDQTIQSVVDQAQPGDTILVSYGIYHERVVIDLNDITLHGVPNEAGDYPILDGEGQLPDGVVASGNNFEIAYLHVRHYTNNGVLVEGVKGVHFHHLITDDTGIYGIYPVQSTDVLIEFVKASNVMDAAIYAGQCENVIVRDSEASDSVLGIELENTVNGEVYRNHTYNNSLGIFIVVLPNLTSKVSTNTVIYDNVTEDNNHVNFARPDMTVAFVPPGLGILLAGADGVEVYNNTIRNNKTTGIALFSLTAAFDPTELDVGPNPENNYIHDNIYENNGYDPVAFVKDMGIPTGDILWDVSGYGNTFDEPTAEGNFPPFMPTSGWPAPLQRVYFRVMNFVISAVG